jgi:hypothetical protein
MSDTLTALQQALTPKGGMQRIPLPTQSYEHPSLPLSEMRLLNYMAEQEPAGARSAVALIATPGIGEWGFPDLGSGPVTAMNGDLPGVVYAVSGTHFYRMRQLVLYGPMVVEDLGDLGAIPPLDYPENLMPTIAVGVNAAVVCSPPNAWTCSHTGALNQIGGDFPGARSVAYLDGYFVFTGDDIDSQFFCTGLLDPANYNALDFAYADGEPNILRLVMTLGTDLWFFGNGAIEIWYDAGSSGLETTPGTSFFPFRRRPGGLISVGIRSMRSVVVCDGSFFFLGTDGIIRRTAGYRTERVSTHALEAAIREMALTSLVPANAISYAQDGHVFYCLTIGQRTFVYDCATKMWHDRSSSADGAQPWRPVSTALLGDQVLFGETGSGRVLGPFKRIPDDGVWPLRSVTMPPLWAGTNRAFCSRLEVETEGHSDWTGDITLEWADDDNVSVWKGGRTLSDTPNTNHRRRLVTTRLGSFHQRVFRMKTHGAGALYAVDADIIGPPNIKGG